MNDISQISLHVKGLTLSSWDLCIQLHSSPKTTSLGIELLILQTAEDAGKMLHKEFSLAEQMKRIESPLATEHDDDTPVQDPFVCMTLLCRMLSRSSLASTLI